MGLDSFTFLGFGVFMLSYLTMSLVWYLFENSLKDKASFNFKKVSLVLSICFIIGVSFSYFLLWQYKNSTPYTNTILDQNKSLYNVYSELFTFNPHITNSMYRNIRYRFVEYLIPFDLNDHEKQLIWGNYIKLIALQVNVRNLLIDIDVTLQGNNINYGYEYDYAKAKVTPFNITSFMTTFNNHKEGASIPSYFDKKSTQELAFKDYGNNIIRANLPYFNNSVPIHKQHMEKIKLIHKMNALSFQIINLNNKMTVK